MSIYRLYTYVTEHIRKEAAYTDLPFTSDTQRILQSIAQPYYSETGSHGWNDHIADVYNTSCELKGSPLSDSEYAAVVLHDIGRKQRNADHNIAGSRLAYDLLRKNKLLTDEQQAIQQAILEHSASWRRKHRLKAPSSSLSELLSLADKGRVYPDWQHAAQRAVKGIYDGTYAAEREEKGKALDIDVSDDTQVASKVAEQLKHWFKDGHIGPENKWSKLYKDQIQARAKAVQQMTEEDVLKLLRQYKREHMQ